MTDQILQLLQEEVSYDRFIRAPAILAKFGVETKVIYSNLEVQGENNFTSVSHQEWVLEAKGYLYRCVVKLISDNKTSSRPGGVVGFVEEWHPATLHREENCEFYRPLRRGEDAE